MADSMIERIARVLDPRAWEHERNRVVTVYSSGERDYPNISDPSTEKSLKMARHLFTIMRDFTGELDARQLGFDGRQCLYFSHDTTALEVWQWVIDQALDGA